jgi:hypothetical protein
MRSLLQRIAAVAVDDQAAAPFTEALERISNIVSTQHLLLPVPQLQDVVNKLTTATAQQHELERQVKEMDKARIDLERGVGRSNHATRRCS